MMKTFLPKIKAHDDELAFALIGRVNYYNEQIFDMKTIAKSGKATGAFVGRYFTNAVGNVALQLHDLDVDFAAWCSYEYMNNVSGNASEIFANEKHLNRTDIPRFEGWVGTKKES